jgi:hypothetical protein
MDWEVVRTIAISEDL